MSRLCPADFVFLLKMQVVLVALATPVFTISLSGSSEGKVAYSLWKVIAFDPRELKFSSVASVGSLVSKVSGFACSTFVPSSLGFSLGGPVRGRYFDK